MHVKRQMFRVQRLTQDARLPTRATPGSAGYDVYSVSTCSIPPGGKKLVPTGIAISCPPGTYARIAPRSGLASRSFVGIGAGVIDADFTGEVHVLMFNHGASPLSISRGDRIAQIVLERIATPAVTEVTSLDDTTRGAAGFGSTGH